MILLLRLLPKATTAVHLGSLSLAITCPITTFSNDQFEVVTNRRLLPLYSKIGSDCLTCLTCGKTSAKFNCNGKTNFPRVDAFGDHAVRCHHGSRLRSRWHDGIVRELVAAATLAGVNGVCMNLDARSAGPPSFVRQPAIYQQNPKELQHPVPALVGRESPVVFEDRLLRAHWGGRARKDASEGYKVTSVRSLACGQATTPTEDEQGAQRWWAVRMGVCHGGARECAMGKNVR